MHFDGSTSQCYLGFFYFVVPHFCQTKNQKNPTKSNLTFDFYWSCVRGYHAEKNWVHEKHDLNSFYCLDENQHKKCRSKQLKTIYYSTQWRDPAHHKKYPQRHIFVYVQKNQMPITSDKSIEENWLPNDEDDDEHCQQMVSLFPVRTTKQWWRPCSIEFASNFLGQMLKYKWL